MSMNPDDFARGAQQWLHGAAPKADQQAAAMVARWLQDIDLAYPPTREIKTVPVENPKRGQPTQRSYMVGAQNDPFVIRFLTDALGPMVSLDTADRLWPSQISRHYSGDGNISDPRVVAAYGVQVCVWSPPDESWSLIFQRDDITLTCHKRPSEADLSKLIFVIGWWTIRTQTHHLEGKWRRMNLTNTGELMRERNR